MRKYNVSTTRRPRLDALSMPMGSTHTTVPRSTHPISVPAQWPAQLPAKIAFVAEAPSDEEVERGIPLIGPSGRVFDSMLRTAGLDRSNYLITNVFDQKLPDNDVKNWCAPMGEARAGGFTDIPPIEEAGFLRPEYRHHLTRLQEELEICRPNVIVPLGGTALWALTGDAAITAHRGSITQAKRLVPGAKLLPTFHPALVIRQWKFFSVVVGDFVKAHTQSLLGPQITYPTRNLLLEPDLNDIRTFIPRLLKSSLLSVDIETGWGQITSVGFAPDAENAICIPFLDKRTVHRNYWPTTAEEVEAWKLVREVMESDTPKLGQNFGGYDAFWFMLKKRIKPMNFIHDTRLLHHALYPELPKDLEFMGASYSTQGAWKNWGRHKEKKDD